jgi:hypothetical protein
MKAERRGRYRWDEDHPPTSGWARAVDCEAHWQDKLIAARLRERGGILVGKNMSTGVPAYVDHGVLGTHMHICGSTGVGKSYFLEGLLKQLIVEGHGICLITPHADIFHRLLQFCAHAHRAMPELRLANRVIPFDIDERRRIMGFNPVARNARIMSYQVVALMEAIRKCWKQDDFLQTPRMARWLFNTGYGVVEPQLTLIQALRLADSKPNPLRQAIVQRIKNEDMRAEWEYIMARKLWEQEDKLESTFLRLRAFTSHETMRTILGQHKGTLDIPAVLSEGKILLVNLPTQLTIDGENQRLLGTMLVNEIFTAAFARTEGSRRPFFLAVDEFQHFVTKDMCEILDGGRKFGLRLVLAHQTLDQLRKKDAEVYYSALANARMKVVFGGMIDEDTEILAKEIYTREFDPYLVKQEIWRTALRPVETTRIIRGTTESEGESEACGFISHASIANGEHYISESGFFHTEPQGTTTSASEGEARSQTRASNWSRARSETRVPWYVYREEQELASREFLSLQEQLFIKKKQLKLQPKQHAVVLVPDQNAIPILAPTIRDYSVSDRQLQDFKAECFEAAGCFKTPEEAEREIDTMERDLLGRDPPITINLTPQLTSPAHDDDNDFDYSHA